MRKLAFAVMALLAISTGPVAALPIHFTASSTITGTFFGSDAFLPIGTQISADVTFNVGPGVVLSGPLPVLGGAAGTFIYDIGGPRTFTLSGNVDYGGFGVSALHSSVQLFFAGSDPANPEFSAFDVIFQLPGDILSSPGELTNLMLAGAITGVGPRIEIPFGAIFGEALNQQVQSFSISVPEPSTLALFGLGLLGFVTLRRRQPFVPPT